MPLLVLFLGQQLLCHQVPFILIRPSINDLLRQLRFDSDRNDVRPVLMSTSFGVLKDLANIRADLHTWSNEAAGAARAMMPPRFNKQISEGKKKEGRMSTATSPFGAMYAIPNAIRSNRFVMAITFIGLIVAIPRAARGANFSCPSGDIQCLISAINAANSNGQSNTLRLAAGDYTLTAVNDSTGGPNGLPLISSILTIKGAGEDRTNITRPVDAPFFRLLQVTSSGSLSLEDLSVSGGRLLSGNGAGMLNSGGRVTILRSTLVENGYPEHGQGGGLYTSGGAVTIRKSTFLDNHAEDAGGIFVNGGTVDISQTRFADNETPFFAGAIEIRGGTVSVEETTFYRNKAMTGAAIRNSNSGTLIVADTAFVEHNAGANGLGALLNLGTAVVTNSTFAANIGEDGVAIYNGGTLTLINSTLVGNSQSYYTTAALTTAGSTAKTILVNTILQNPNAPIDCLGPVTSLGHNIISNPTSCAITLQPTDIIGVPSLGPFTDDGTPGNGHFPLLVNSPAIGAGSSALCPRTDQLGKKRNGPCDIGAVAFRD